MTKKEKTWQEKAERKEIRASASQIETFKLCKRKWWYDKVRRVPRGGPTHAQAFGTVLHAVCERYLEADDLGRDPVTGEPVDLFPPGWHRADNRYGGCDGELSIGEQDLVKALIAMAIEEGVLERRPGREVEKYFRQSVLKMEDGTNIQIEGYIDVAYPDTIEDHKTSKSTRYLKGKEGLAKNPQVLIYAKMALEDLRKKGGAIPPFLTVRHNQYVKDPDKPHVRKTEVEIPISDIDEFWELEILPTLEEMYRVRKNAREWTDVEDPPNIAKACNAYGGCEFRPICGGRESLETFCSKFDPEKKPGYNVTPLTVGGEDKNIGKGATMNLRDRMNAQKAAAKGNAPTSVNPPVEEGTKTKAPSVASSKAKLVKPKDGRELGTTSSGVELELAPWVDPENMVTINHGLGFTKKGEICAQSSARAEKNGLPTPDMFELEPMGDGTVTWVGKDDTPVEGLQGRSPFSIDAVPSEEETPEEAAQEETEETSQEETQEETSEETEEETSQEEDDAVKEALTIPPGRAKKSFLLAINCVPYGYKGNKGGGRFVYDLHQIARNLQDIMAEDFGVESYFDINFFERRDALMKHAPKLAERFGTDIVFVSDYGTGESDMKALVEALKPYAGTIIRGLA